MATFELIPCRLYLSQSKTWMHKIKAEIKMYTVVLLWIAIFVLSYDKLLIIALSLIITSSTVKSNTNTIKKHLFQTFVMTVLTALFSFSLANSYKNYSLPEKTQDICYYNNTKKLHGQNNIQLLQFKKIREHKLFFVTKPALYFFITIYSIKLVMMTTAPEILAITIYRTKIINKFFSSELLFIFLLSSHIITNIIVKLDKTTQVISLRGSLNLYKRSTNLLTLFFLISKVFFFEITRESREISQALYTRNLNRENENFLKVYQAKSSANDFLVFIIGTTSMLILLLV